MIDAPKVLRDYLAAQASLTALTSTRIYAERNYPMPGYNPSDGACVVFRSRGGRVQYSSKILTNSFQIKCYAADEADANTLYRTLYDALHDAKGSGIYHGGLEIAGQTLADMTTGWVYVLAFFEVKFRIDS
ncbi:MAG: hypothetical protein ACPGWR_13685 [Ardenticatenaceae bacterium]